MTVYRCKICLESVQEYVGAYAYNEQVWIHLELKYTLCLYDWNAPSPLSITRWEYLVGRDCNSYRMKKDHIYAALS